MIQLILLQPRQRKTKKTTRVEKERRKERAEKKRRGLRRKSRWTVTTARFVQVLNLCFLFALLERQEDIVIVVEYIFFKLHPVAVTTETQLSDNDDDRTQDLILVTDSGAEVRKQCGDTLSWMSVCSLPES